LEETLAQARVNGHKEGIATSIVTLGLLTYEQGDYGSASATYKEGLELHRELGNKRGVSTALLGLGLIAVSTGQIEMGVRLLGATEALIEEVGIILENEERSPYDRALSTASKQLGEEVFSRAWREGHGMSMEQAIEYALQSEQP
jgi:hypothetical protein